MKHLYWIKFRRNGGLPVRFPAMPRGSRRFRWTGLYGVQIGDWFIGAVKGRVDPLPTPPVAPNLAQGGETL